MGGHAWKHCVMKHIASRGEQGVLVSHPPPPAHRLTPKSPLLTTSNPNRPSILWRWCHVAAIARAGVGVAVVSRQHTCGQGWAGSVGEPRARHAVLATSGKDRERCGRRRASDEQGAARLRHRVGRRGRALQRSIGTWQRAAPLSELGKGLDL
jgi:hypothetical protein